MAQSIYTRLRELKDSLRAMKLQHGIMKARRTNVQRGRLPWNAAHSPEDFKTVQSHITSIRLELKRAQLDYNLRRF